MKELVFDGSTVSDGRLTAGTWDLEIVKVEQSESAAKNPCMDVHFREVNDEGRQFERIPWIESTFWRIKRLIAAAGLDPEAKFVFSDLKQDLVGSVIRAEITIEDMPDGGGSRPQIKSMSPVK
jgi:hypothetical protein